MATPKSSWIDYAILEPSTPTYKDGKKVEWKVQRNAEHQFRCSCPSFIFSKTTPRSCKHTRVCVAEAQSVDVLAKAQASVATNVAAFAPPSVSPLLAEATRFFDAMCGEATMKVRFNVRDQLGKEASRIMVEVLAARLTLFNPAAARVAAPVKDVLQAAGVRRITFDDE